MFAGVIASFVVQTSRPDRSRSQRAFLTSTEATTTTTKCVERSDATNSPPARSKKEARNEHAVMLPAWCEPFTEATAQETTSGFDSETDTHLHCSHVAARRGTLLQRCHRTFQRTDRRPEHSFGSFCGSSSHKKSGRLHCASVTKRRGKVFHASRLALQ